MTVYVDNLFYAVPKNIQAARYGKEWCHLFSLDLEELHSMALKLGLKREYFQDRKLFPHYDLTPNKRELALSLGAIPMQLSEFIVMSKKCHN